ncbi:MAG TPA: hypothetical protein VHS06_09790 [Chloroflexota bacterium]|nr:hypothetical protein [Chloroflexota bacterium]
MSRRRLGVREQAFLQTGPQGDMVVVILEGTDPASAFRQFGAGNDDFTRWFVQQVKEIHGMDLSQPSQLPMPQLGVDSDMQVRRKAA